MNMPDATQMEANTRKRNEPWSAPSAPTEEAIRRRAYQLFLARGEADGSDVQDWLEAEAQLRQEYEAALRVYYARVQRESRPRRERQTAPLS